ncbi:hypothetical protein ILYODFUR_011215 [Ilyodon furcidens]|uniref:Uncharacterized protein n=1 Tax=Ilyodon furcidens TaxID=33524 RepID=A0ABV0USA7_9TELE
MQETLQTSGIRCSGKILQDQNWTLLPSCKAVDITAYYFEHTIPVVGQGSWMELDGDGWSSAQDNPGRKSVRGCGRLETGARSTFQQENHPKHTARAAKEQFT